MRQLLRGRNNCRNRYRPHEAIGDCLPMEAMEEFLGRFEEGMTYDPKVMTAV